MRSSLLVQIPEIYFQNEKNGLCRICAKPKTEWDSKRFTKHCSDTCSSKWQACFITWGKIRSEVLKEQNHTCQLCSQRGEEVDHILAIVNGGAMWDKTNLRVLCHKCHVKKTKDDLGYKIKPGQIRLTEVQK